MTVNKIYEKECLAGLRELPENSVDCCITSPPYFGLRDYGVDGQLGLERTPEMYVAKLVEVFTEVKRVLKKEGTLWLNLGDSYAGSWGNYGGQNRGKGKQREILAGSQAGNKAYEGKENWRPPTSNKHNSIKSKDLIGIPWMVAFAMRSSGWYLRQDIIWSKPNPMPESVKDRCTKAHEYIFLLSKDKRYYFDQDAIRQPHKEVSLKRWANGGEDTQNTKYEKRKPTTGVGNLRNGSRPLHSDGANKRSVWTVPPKPFKGSHFATFPEALISDMIKAGCPENGIVLDPFIGAGTTAVVAAKLKRNYIGFEINADYIKIAETRIQNYTL